MKRLRHPIRAIREPFGTAGLIVAMVALVAALGGTALAASKLNSTQKKEVEKIAKKYAGKPGAPGATGPAGPAGAAGAAGKEGPAGKEGVVGKEGPQGKQGIQGLPGTTGFTETLPSGKTETGAWTMQAWAAEAPTLTSISFPIPLEVGLAGANVVFLEEGHGGTAECPGTAGSPEAKNGFLCVYENAGNSFELNEFGVGPIMDPSKSTGAANHGAGKSGALVLLNSKAAITPPVFAEGTWAVTAP